MSAFIVIDTQQAIDVPVLRLSLAGFHAFNVVVTRREKLNYPTAKYLNR